MNCSPIGNWLLPASSRSASHPCSDRSHEHTAGRRQSSSDPDYRLYLEFENGEKRVFDMSPYMDKRPFASLKGSPLFTMASVDYGTVVWPGNIDIAP
jgi:hypothetical protein